MVIRGLTPMDAAERARAVLQLVKDPEVPVLSIVELGIVRKVEADPEAGRVTVTITPTYSGCPAMKMIEEEITAALGSAGFREVKIETVYAPAWTTDWIGERAREKLRQFGIAPPGLVKLETAKREDARTAPGRVEAGDSLPACPHCGSTETGLVSEFGATACKSLYVCRSCRQPFERFKTF
jgi:ring-1,2-phenylacetyl-CoA epoxidase subunit PaaD